MQKQWYRQKEVAEIIGVSPAYINKLVKECKIRKNSTSKVLLAEVQAYITKQDKIEQSVVKDEEYSEGINFNPTNYTEAKTLKEYMLAKKIEFELDVLKGKYASFDDVKFDAERIATAVKEKLYAIPNSFGHYLVHLGLNKKDIADITKELRKLITESLTELQRIKFK